MQKVSSLIRLYQLKNYYLKRFVSTKNNLKTITSPTDSVNGFPSDDLVKNSDLLKLDTKFENAEIAFKSKKTFDLIRGWLVFQLCSISPLVNNQQKVSYVTMKAGGVVLLIIK